VPCFDAAPQRLEETGLYADFGGRQIRPDALPFSPQYPLWTDGAEKHRWLWLPPGTAIDASDVDHWQFPIGTRLWKEFAFDGRPVETRFMHRRGDGTWLYATYRWSDDGADALLTPEVGARAVCATGGGAFHDLPSIGECRLCHEGGGTPVLGFSALQLSPDRDPMAPGGVPARAGEVDLPALQQRGLLRGLPERWRTEAPRIAARSPDERAALGYLHGNCSNCHNAEGPLQRLGLRLDYPLEAGPTAPALATTVGVSGRFARGDASVRIAPGDPHRSTLLQRIEATDPLARMPPFGRHQSHGAAIELLRRWVENDLDRVALTLHPTDPTQSRRP